MWRQASFAGILLLAGLQTLPEDLNEAASLDGAGVFQRFRNITLPWLKPALVTVTVLNIIYAFLQFDVIFAMTQGGPGDATQVLSILIYRQLFGVTQIGLGSALAVILGFIALAGGLLTVDEACQRYSLSLEEFTGWQRAVDRSGMPGLRVTRIKHYRDQYERQQRY